MCNRLLSCLVVFMALALPAYAQTPSGEISGTVVDSSGSVLPGVRVTLTNSGTNAVRLTQTNETGLYVFPAVPPGTYAVKVELEGFSTAQQTNINVQVGSAYRFPFTMSIGALTDVVSVVADTPVIQTENASIGTVIENRSIVELPLNGRNYLQLASLIPGATTNGPASAQGQQRMGGQRNSFSLNVAGQRIHYNHYSLDGVENTDLNFNSYMLLPSVDALEEFKVESGIFGAEFGRAVAQINASTKSGTNAFHGTVFEFLRNAKMDSKNFFDPKDKPIPPFSRNQYGTTIGGPVVSNKLFFMFNWEGLRENKALTSNASLPLTAWKAGDFSNLRDASGNLIVIYDPATAVFDAAGNVVRAPTAFPDNKIPANRIHPASQKLLKYYPTPDQERTGANFVNNEERKVDMDQFTYRLDYAQSATMNWFFRHSISRELGYDPFAVPNMGSNTDTDVNQMVFGNTQTIGTNKLNDLRIGYGQLKNAHISPRANVENVVKELGINIVSDNPLYWGVPNIGVTGLSGLGEESDAPFINDDKTIQFVDNFSWILGNHSVKFGGELRRVLYDQIGGVVTRGRFNFDGRYTRQPLLPAAQRGGAAFADFLLGTMNNSESQVGAPIADFRSNYYAVYIQDNWKMTPNVTLDFGLRWEYDQPFTDKDDKIVNIDYVWDNSRAPVFVRTGTGDPYEDNPPFNLGTVPYVRDGRFGRGAYKPDYNDIAPRLGLAWSVDPKTVVRAGGGIYYVRDIGNAVFDTVRNAPFTIRRNEPAETFRPNLSFEQPFARTGSPTFILAAEYDVPSSYIGQWSLGFQRELPGMITGEVTYFGSAGVHLRRLQTYNNTEPSALANTNLSRPFPDLGGMQVMNAPSHSKYHALYLKAQKRFSHGLSFLSSFSYGKSVDNGSGVRTSVGDPLTPSNNYDLTLEEGPSAFDFRKRWTSSWIYELPFGRDRKFMNNNAALDYVLGGWQIGGILTFQDGFPFTLNCSTGTVQNGGGGCYPDPAPGAPDWKLDDPTRERWFNTAAFVDRNPEYGTGFRYGTVRRNSVVGPGIKSFDMSFNKNFQVKDDHLEFRIEIFNLPNTAIWGQPGSQLGTPTYGVITSTRLDSRQVQLGLKYVF
jgi:hypothetical protein